MKLNPSCSEIVFRLVIDDKKLGEDGIWTDSYPNGCTESMLWMMKGLKPEEIDKVEYEFLENNGGGGCSSYVENCFELAKEVMRKKISKEEALKKENYMW